MKDSVSFDLNNEELSELGYQQLKVMNCKSNLLNILSFCKEKRIRPKTEFLFEKAWLPDSIVNFAKGFSYEELDGIENRFTDFVYNGKACRLLYVLTSGKKEAIPVVTDYYTSTLWFILQDIWIKKKK